MGEKRTLHESVVSNESNIVNFVLDDHLPINGNIDVLLSFCLDNLIYVQYTDFFYNKCKLGAIVEAALIVRNGGENA